MLEPTGADREGGDEGQDEGFTELFAMQTRPVAALTCGTVTKSPSNVRVRRELSERIIFSSFKNFRKRLGSQCDKCF